MASKLTGKLLVFASYEIKANRNCRPVDVLMTHRKSLRTLRPEEIEFKLDCSLNCSVPLAEQEFQQIIFNLALNAKVPMPYGGNFSNDCRALEATEERPPGLEQIDVVTLEFINNGEGSAPEHMKEVIDPYFAAKGVKGHWPLARFIVGDHQWCRWRRKDHISSSIEDTCHALPPSGRRRSAQKTGSCQYEQRK